MPHKDPEAARAWSRKWRQANRARLKAKEQAWRDRNREALREAQRAWRAARAAVDPFAERSKKLVQRYGLSHEDYLVLYTAQDGKCAICEKPFAKLDVDHNHVTNLVRGLLCRRHNLLIGFLEDQELLRQAFRYLGWPVPE